MDANDFCLECKHFWGMLNCDAFPKGIPKEITDGESDHSKPLPNQGNDIIFEPIK